MNYNQPLKEILTSDGFEQLKKGHPWIFKNHLKKDFSLPQKPMRSIGVCGVRNKAAPKTISVKSKKRQKISNSGDAKWAELKLNQLKELLMN